MSIPAECVTGYSERRIRINLPSWRIPYVTANFMNANRNRTGNAK